MRQLAITAVMQNGAEPDDDADHVAPFAQGIDIPQWTDCRLNVSCADTAGDPFDITGGALILSAKARPTQEEPDLSFEATITDADEGQAYFVIGSVDSGAVAVRSYGYVIVYIDADGKIWPVVAEGTLAITPSEYVPGQAVTVPESQQPLAQGPPGIWLGARYTVTAQDVINGADVLAVPITPVQTSASYGAMASVAEGNSTITAQVPISGRTVDQVTVLLSAPLDEGNIVEVFCARTTS